MQLDRHVFTLGRYLRQRFGERVHKLSLNAGFTCPNRDGTLGRGGCTFCNVRAFNDDDSEPSLEQQILVGKEQKDRARRYLAYFQAYTNTYAEVDELRRLYQQALSQADMVGLCVGTRPDCVPDAVLELLAGYRAQGLEVWLELGLQSAFDATLVRINRGHDWAAYEDATRRAQRWGVPVATHLIVGLPGEKLEDSLTTLKRVLDLGVQGLKIHPLMIVKGSRMAAHFARGELAPPELEAYADVAAEMIRRTPEHIVYHRVSATARAPTLIAPEWCDRPWRAINAITRRLDRDGPQGSALGRLLLA